MYEMHEVILLKYKIAIYIREKFVLCIYNSVRIWQHRKANEQYESENIS